jgi:ribosomal protein S18 acetylase RimI-like enzyme
MKVQYRIARTDDLDVLADLMELSSGGIIEFLLDGLFANTPRKEVIKLALGEPESTLYYENYLVAEIDGAVIGAANFYPAHEHGVPEIMRAFIPKERIEHLSSYVNSRVENSLYIHTLSVFPSHRFSAAGLGLFKCCEKIAAEMGCHCLSAHVWKDNLPVVSALKRGGFEEVEEIDVQPHELLPHTGGMVLMRGQELKER